MNSPQSYRTQIVLSLCSFMTLAVCLTCVAQAQDGPFTSAPPPMKFVSHSERAQLSSARDVKARTRASIELAELRLKRAEELTTALQYDDAASELGCYQGIMEDAMRYLSELPNKAKMRDIFKRIELNLRAQGIRLEALRRVTPAEYSINIKPIADYTRSARTEALNAFYGDTVVRYEEARREEEKAPAADNVKTAADTNVKAFVGEAPKKQ